MNSSYIEIGGHDAKSLVLIAGIPSPANSRLIFA